jgi:hypothetical protein
MLNTKRTAALSLVISLIILSSPVAAQGPAPGQATGEKIGTIVKAAIDTALPGVTSILGLIWGGKKEGDKISKQQLEDAIKSAREDLRQQFAANALEKIQPVKKVADELATLYKFMEPATEANESIIRIQAVISANPTITDPVQAQLKKEWSIATKQLVTLNGVDVNKTVRDGWLREKLIMIQDLNKRMVGDISDQIDAKNAGELRDSLKDAAAALAAINRVSRVEVADLQSDIGGLASLGEGKAGDDKPAIDASGAMQSVDKELSELGKKFPAK